MKNTRIFRLCLAAALCVGLSPSGADAQAQAPLITAAIPDAESANLTIGGAGFRAGFPVVYLGNLELPVRWATESTVDTWLPELQPGTYRLIARWPDGSQADFYLTLGAAGPAGPAGAPGPRGDRGLPGFGGAAHFGAGTAAAPEGSAAADSTSTSTVRHTLIYRQNGVTTPAGLTGTRNTGFGWNVLGRMTTGGSNTSFGAMALQGVTTGRANTAIGAVAMQLADRVSSNNTAIGRGALRRARASDNIAVGVNAGSVYPAFATGNHNIYIGNGQSTNPTGSRNIYIGHTGEPGDSGVVRLGNGNTQTKTYLAGEVIVHGSITGVGGGPLNLTGPVNAPALNTRIEELSTGIKASVDDLKRRVTALEAAP